MTEKQIGSNMDLSSADNAFKSFFGVKDMKDIKKADSESNPVNAVLNQQKDNETPPDKLIKVDGNSVKDATQVLQVDEAKRIVDKEKTFKEILKEFKIKTSELFVIIDSYLTKGYFEEKQVVGTFEFAFKTRKVYSIEDMTVRIDKSDAVTQGGIEQQSLLLRMASSLTYYKLGDKPARVFSHDKPEDDDVVLQFIKAEVSSPIYAIMRNKMNSFDIRVGLATRDEAIESFLTHSTVSDGRSK